MNWTEYDERKRGVTRRLLVALLRLCNPFLTPSTTSRLSKDDLLTALSFLVNQYAYESGVVAREFYDTERERVLGLEDRHDFYVSEPHPLYIASVIGPAVDEFYERIDLAFADDDVPDRPDPSTEVAKLIGSTEHLVSYGDRSTMMDGAESDPACIGWARVEHGGSSCAWCTMLISRGPVYRSASSAGGAGPEQVVRKAQKKRVREGRSLVRAPVRSMREFHPHCDCRVVPVFDENDWPGRDEYKAAEDAYIKASKEASKKGQSVYNALRYQLRGREVPDRTKD